MNIFKLMEVIKIKIGIKIYKIKLKWKKWKIKLKKMKNRDKYKINKGIYPIWILKWHNRN